MARVSSEGWWSRRLAGWIDKVREGDVELFLQIFRELVKDIVNSVFVDRNAELLIPLVVMVLAIFLAKGLSTYFQTVLSQRISNAMVADIRKRLINHVVAQRVEFFSKNASDSLLMKFNQGAQAFNQILNLVLVNGLRDFATLVGLVIVMLIQDPMLTLVSFTVAPVVFYGVTMLMRKMKDMAQEEMAGFAELNRLVRETVQGITVIKAYNLEAAAKSDSEDVIHGIQDRADRMARCRRRRSRCSIRLAARPSRSRSSMPAFA